MPTTLTVTAVAPELWRETIGGLGARGGRPLSLFAAAATDGGTEVRCLAESADGPLLAVCPVVDGVVPSLAGLVPALHWDEREARDLHGVVFAGHEPHRPLVHHPADLAEWTTPVTGDDVHQVAVGPIHAGVIESGHFRFHSVGERILHIDVRLFHKHRGLEVAAEGLVPHDALPVVQRACAACAVANSVAFADAVEQAGGRVPDEPTRRARTLLIELERVYNHANDIGAMCAGVGLAPGAMVFAHAKERAQRIIRDLTGHRFMFGAVTIGGSTLAIGADAAAGARAALAELGRDTAAAWRALLFDASLRDRVAGAGVLPRDEALRLGVVGPAARASGVRRDLREDAPRLWYPGFGAVLPAEPVGDVAARMEARAVELAQSLAILDDLLSGGIGPGSVTGGGEPAAHGAGRVESARGETSCVVELEVGRVRRVHLRTASYANWPAVARAATGAILPDFPLVNKSFELCYACVDR
jgi:Ni,Fe-hydrogenase III large subunit